MMKNVFLFAQLAAEILVAIVLLIGFEILSKHISQSIQQQVEATGVFKERLDTAISLTVLGVGLIAFVLIAEFPVMRIGAYSITTLMVVSGGIAALLGVSDALYVIQYKIPKFKAKYGTEPLFEQ